VETGAVAARNKAWIGAVGGIALLAASSGAPAGPVLVRRLETWGDPGLGIQNPFAIAFAPEPGRFFVAEARPDELRDGPRASLLELGPALDGARRVFDLSRITADPSGLAYHPARRTLLVTDDDEIALYELALDGRRVAHLDLADLGARDPEGVACDPETGHLFVADGRGQQILELTPSGRLVSTLPLGELGFHDASGITFDQSSGQLLVADGRRALLYALTRAGAQVASWDLGPLGVVHPRGLTVAPTSDPSDPPDAQSLYLVDDLIKDAPDGRLLELGFSRRPRGGRTLVHLLGDVDGFGFRGDEAGFDVADANHDGVLVPGEQIPSSALGRADSIDNRDPEDPAGTDRMQIVGEAAPLRFTHALPLGGADPLWARLTLAVGDARVTPLQRNLLRVDGHLVGEILGSTRESLVAGGITATIVELPPAVLRDLRDGRLSVEIARPPGGGDDDIMLDYARLEVAIGP
jgi:hypothetical protein